MSDIQPSEKLAKFGIGFTILSAIYSISLLLFVIQNIDDLKGNYQGYLVFLWFTFSIFAAGTLTLSRFAELENKNLTIIGIIMLIIILILGIPSMILTVTTVKPGIDGIMVSISLVLPLLPMAYQIVKAMF